MTDPAIDAAQKASDQLDWRSPTEQQQALLVVGAREALKPIREVLDKLAADTEPPCHFAKEFEAMRQAIHEISGLAFADEEMKR